MNYYTMKSRWLSNGERVYKNIVEHSTIESAIAYVEKEYNEYVEKSQKYPENFRNLLVYSDYNIPMSGLEYLERPPNSKSFGSYQVMIIQD